MPAQVTDTIYVKKPNHVLHFLLTVVTGGLWLPVWIVVALRGKRVKAL